MKKKPIHLKLLTITILSCLLCIQACRKLDAGVQHGAVVGAPAKVMQSSFLQTPVIYTLAGNGVPGFADGTSAMLNQPAGAVVDAAGNVYVADMANNRIRKITVAGIASTLAGSGTAALADGAGTTASFNAPAGLALDAGGNIIVADKGNNCIRKITPDGVVTTIAGASNADYVDGAIAAARFNSPSGVAVDTAGNNILVADTKNQCLRAILLQNNQVITLAGKFNQPDTTGGTIGQLGSTRLKYPFGVTIDAFGNILITDSASIRRIINGSGMSTTLAGSGSPGFNDATGADARFNGPAGITTDAAGNAYVADRGNNRIRVVTQTGTVSTLVGTIAGFADGTGSLARLNLPAGVAVGASGTVYIADQGNHRLREFAQARIGTVSTLAGGNSGFADGQAANAMFADPAGTAIDDSGNVFVADMGNGRIRKISPAGIVSTLAGNGAQGFADGPGANAKFSGPTALAIDRTTGNIYVSDAGNHRIRKVTRAGVVSTLAGSGVAGFADGNGTAAQFNFPWGVAVDSHGNVFVGDEENHLIRKITPSGMVSTFAGSTRGYADGPGTLARFNTPEGVAIDKADNIYVVEFYSNRVRKISPAGVVSTMAGSGVEGYADGIGVHAMFDNPYAIAVDSLGIVYVADYGNTMIRSISPTGIVTTVAGDGQLGYVNGIGTQAEFWFPTGIGSDALGNLYVGDNSNNRIRKIQ